MHGLNRTSQNALGFLSSGKSKFANKFVFGAAAVLAILVLPLAVQAVSGSLESNDEQPSQTEPAVSGVSDEQKESDATNNSQHETSVDISNDADTPGQTNGSNVEVTIDGEEVPVPPSGRVHQKKSSNHTESVVDINIQGDSSNSSYTNIKINNQHYSSDDEDDESGGRLDNHR